MKHRPSTPPAGPTVRELLVPRARLRSARSAAAGPLVTVRAKNHDALMSATAKAVAALKIDNHSEPVLVVYGDKAASVFCDRESGPKLVRR